MTTVPLKEEYTEFVVGRGGGVNPMAKGGDKGGKGGNVRK